MFFCAWKFKRGNKKEKHEEKKSKIKRSSLRCCCVFQVIIFLVNNKYRSWFALVSSPFTNQPLYYHKFTWASDLS